jgi:hypothetical protein
MNKIVNYDWGELKVKVEEARVFDTKNNKFIGSVPCARIEDVDFDKLVKELVKRKDNAQVPFVIKCNDNKKEQSVSELANNIDESAYVKDITINNIVDIVKKYFRKGKSKKE